MASDMMRAMSRPEALSRTTVAASTRGAAAPIPCSARAIIIVVNVPDAAAASAATA